MDVELKERNLQLFSRKCQSRFTDSSSDYQGLERPTMGVCTSGSRLVMPDNRYTLVTLPAAQYHHRRQEYKRGVIGLETLPRTP